jgi:hypothetical protein
MAFATIDKPSKYFNTKLYTGNGTSQSITGVGFSPDLVWLKNRDSAYYHCLYDLIRGTGTSKSLYSNTTEQEGNQSAHFNLSSFDSDGFTLGTTSSTNLINTNSQNHVAWNWKANGTGVSNTSGTISSTVSANTTSGFSIVSYTGNSTSGATIGHGLGVKPSMIITKQRSGDVAEPAVYHTSTGATKFFKLNETGAVITNSTLWNNTEPTSTVFTVGTAALTNASFPIIAYCFAEVKGFSKFGSYTGNGNADGTFVYTGFKPAFVMTKSSSTGGTYYDWGIMDNKRANSFNVIDAQVCANLSDQENSANIGSQKIDFLSNGFKPRVNGSSHNGSGVTYIYMAFAESPFTSSKGIPTTAR